MAWAITYYLNPKLEDLNINAIDNHFMHPHLQQMPITYATTMYSFNCHFITCHLFIGHYLCTPYVLGWWIRAPATHFFGARILTTLFVLFILRPLAPCRNICLPLLCHYTVLPVPNSTGPYLDDTVSSYGS